MNINFREVNERILESMYKSLEEGVIKLSRRPPENGLYEDRLRVVLDINGLISDIENRLYAVDYNTSEFGVVGRHPELEIVDTDNELYFWLCGREERINDLLITISKYAIGVDKYELGLPDNEVDMRNMRAKVLSWIKEIESEFESN